MEAGFLGAGSESGARGGPGRWDDGEDTVRSGTAGPAGLIGWGIGSRSRGKALGGGGGECVRFEDRKGCWTAEVEGPEGRMLVARPLEETDAGRGE